MQIPGWLKNAIFYQVYPASFYDSNGDGIGDLPGIIEKLGYIRDLGCNAIWLNPCFESPFHDGGYDISDYYRVGRRYGTNADLRRLFRKAHQMGIRVILDLVAAHTSTEHPWFKASCRAKKNKYSNWYVWTDSVWMRASGYQGTVRGYGQRDGCFMPNFFYCQPALNFGFARPERGKKWQLSVNHPDVRQVRREVVRILRYWLDAGCDGFRVDMAGSIVKNDPGWKETSRFWRQVRAMLDRRYPQAVLISEWSSPRYALRAGFSLDMLLHFNDMDYNFLFRQESKRNLFTKFGGHSFFDRSGNGDITGFVKSYLGDLAAAQRRGLIGLPTGSHDLSRIRLGRTQKEVEVIFAFILTMPGVPFIYYGDEIGMRYISSLASKEGGYCRTGSRTPMQWTNGNNAGFSRAAESKLYLPVDKSAHAPSVSGQLRRKDSLLGAVKGLISLRKKFSSLGSEGNFVPLYAKKNKYPFVYLRQKGGERILVAVNPSGGSAEALFSLPVRPDGFEILTGVKTGFSLVGKKCRLTIKPSSYTIIRLN